MNLPTVYETTYFIFDYNTYDSYADVMAYNEEEGTWENVSLVQVEESDNYSRFFFLDDLPVVEPKTPVQKAKKKINELIEWIEKFSVHSSGVKEVLHGYKEDIFQTLDEMKTSR
jgi:hypothetical protein